jgi:TonB family protein
VSFGAAVLLAGLVLLGVAALRYPLAWAPDRTSATVVVVEAPERPEASAERPPQRPQRPQREDAPQAVAPPQDVANAAPSEPPVITDPVWLERPRNTARFYPRGAFMQGVEGRVVLDCFVEVNGQLACAVASETPPGQGFGDAALAIASEHVMQPATHNGAPVRARYRMIVPFSTSG